MTLHEKENDIKQLIEEVDTDLELRFYDPPEEPGHEWGLVYKPSRRVIAVSDDINELAYVLTCISAYLQEVQ